MRLRNWLDSLKGLLSTTRCTDRNKRLRRARRARGQAASAVIQTLESRAMLSATVSLVATDADLTEPGGGAPYNPGSFTVTRTNDAFSQFDMVMVNYTFSGPANQSWGTDFTASLNGMQLSSNSGMITFMSNDNAARVFTLIPLQDGWTEGDETFTLTLSTPWNCTIGSSTATGTIHEIAPTVSVTAPIPTTSEPSSMGGGASPGTFRVTRQGNTMGSLIVQFNLSGSATPGAGAVNDYALSVPGGSGGSLQMPSGGNPGQVTIPSGQSSIDILVTPNYEPQVEGNETVVLTLVDNTNPAYDLGANVSATVTINDLPGPAFNVTPPATNPINEGSQATIIVSTSAVVTTWKVDWGNGMGPQSYAGNYNSQTGTSLLTAVKTYEDDDLTAAESDDYEITITALIGGIEYDVTENPVPLTVNNVAPTWHDEIEPILPTSIRPFETFWLVGRFEDPGVDFFTYSIDWGDGSEEDSGDLYDKDFEFFHPYFEAGSYEVTFQIEDDDGGVLEWTGTIEVVNHAPVIVIDSPESIDIGQDLILDATDTYDVDGDTLTFLWDLDNDGTYETNTNSNPIVSWEFWDTLYYAGFTAGEERQIGVRVVDEYGLAADETITLEVEESSSEGTISEEPIRLPHGPSEFGVFENTPTGTIVGNVVEASGLTDPDSFTITGGTGASMFEIEEDGSLILTAAVAGFNESWTVEISASGSQGSATFTVTVILVPEFFGGSGSGSDVEFDLSFPFPSSAPIGSTFGPLGLIVDGAPADEYQIISGNESGRFDIDSNGIITIVQAPTAGDSGTYVLQIQGRNTLTGNTTDVTIALLANGPLTQPVPVRYSANTLVMELDGLDIVPTRFGDLRAPIKYALEHPERAKVRGANPHGGVWVVEYTGTQVAVLTYGPKVLTAPEILWQQRLLAIENKHKGMLYYQSFQLKDVFTKLRNATAKLSFGPNGDATAAALYQTGTGWPGSIAVSNIAAESAETIIHESVHALDHQNGWYLPNKVVYIEDIEALAYATEHMFGTLNQLAALEKTLLKTTSTAEEVQNSWYLFVQNLNSLFSDPGTIVWETIPWTSNSRSIRPSDVGDVVEKVKFKYRVGTLVHNIYQSLANQREIDFTFSMTGITRSGGNSNSLSVPMAFRA